MFTEPMREWCHMRLRTCAFLWLRIYSYGRLQMVSWKSFSRKTPVLDSTEQYDKHSSHGLETSNNPTRGAGTYYPQASTRGNRSARITLFERHREKTQQNTATLLVMSCCFHPNKSLNCKLIIVYAPRSHVLLGGRFRPFLSEQTPREMCSSLTAFLLPMLLYSCFPLRLRGTEVNTCDNRRYSTSHRITSLLR